MKNLSNKTIEQLKEIRLEYVGQYIGDFDKPSDYTEQLVELDIMIESSDFREGIKIVKKYEHKPDISCVVKGEYYIGDIDINEDLDFNI